jgi:hypothetical protein
MQNTLSYVDPGLGSPPHPRAGEQSLYDLDLSHMCSPYRLGARIRCGSSVPQRLPAAALQSQ